MNAYDSVKSMGGPIRTVGWSVEGGVLRKENGRITKSVIRNLALTQRAGQRQDLRRLRQVAQSQRDREDLLLRRFGQSNLRWRG